MAYSTGSTILDDEYNLFASQVNTYWGQGGVSYAGYGQSTTIPSVTVGTTITATQWATLLARITSMANHQGSSITAITTPSTGDTISVLAGLTSNISTIESRRFYAAASGTDSTTTNNTTSSWGTSATITKTITFASVAQAAYYFNAGGMIRISLSRSGGTARAKNTAWSNLLTACGTLVWTGESSTKTIAGTTYAGLTKIGGSGSTTVFSNTGVRAMSSTNTERFRQFDATYLYTSNYVTISTQWSGIILTLNISLFDVDTDPETVDGTLSLSTTIRPPSTTYLSNTWGTPTANTPSWSVS